MTDAPAPPAEQRDGGGGVVLTAEDRVALEAERDFLLTSIRDLETERAAGELATDQYDPLVAGYLARAAKVLRALDAAADQPAPPHGAPSRAPRPWRRRLVVIIPLGVAVVLTAGLLPGALAQRERGQTITGNAQPDDGHGMPAVPQPAEIRSLDGVYNAVGTLRGELAYVAAKISGRAHCALCDITHRGIRHSRAFDLSFRTSR